MSFTVSTNMGLIIPTVGQEDGPLYAQDVNDSLSRIDGHDHSLGNGVFITPDGLNINASLPMNGQSLTTIGALTLSPQGSDAVANSIYEKGVDLYYRDGAGNVIRITQSGSVSGAAGTITGLPSGTASASYGAGVFTFQAATLTPANIDGGAFVLRNNVASSFGLTLYPPAAMAADTQITLPSIPSQTSILTIDSSGNIAPSIRATIIQDVLNAGSNNTTTPLGVGGCNITPSGSRPVLIQCLPNASGSYVQVFTASGNASGAISCVRSNDSTTIGLQAMTGSAVTNTIPISSLSFIDVSPLSNVNNNYNIFISVAGGVSPTIAVSSSKIIAREI